MHKNASLMRHEGHGVHVRKKKSSVGYFLQVFLRSFWLSGMTMRETGAVDTCIGTPRVYSFTPEMFDDNMQIRF